MPQDRKPKKWRRFEQFVAAIQKNIAPNAKITHDDSILGKSGVVRQIDVSVRTNLGQFTLLAVIDCKDWKVPVDINDVGSFADTVEDVRANKGAIICNAGFTEGAKLRAKEKGIDLFRAFDLENVDWPVYISIPTVYDFRLLKTCSYGFQYTGTSGFMIPDTDLRFLELYRGDGSFIDILQNLLIKAWNLKKISSEPGRWNDLPFIDDKPYTKVEGILYGPVQITASITVEQSLYFGEIPLKKGQGFRNELTGVVTTKSFSTADINFDEIREKWRKVASMDELVVSPGMVLCASPRYQPIDYNPT